MFISKKNLYLETLSGEIKSVPQLSILNTEQFRQRLKEINTECENPVYKDKNITQVYVEGGLLKHLIDKLLALLDLNANDFSGEVLFSLIFPHQTPDGGYSRQGLLSKHILGEIKEGAILSKEDVDQYAKTLGQLWASVQSFNEVIAAVQQLDYDTLYAALGSRAEALKPAEQKEKEESQAKAKEEFKKFKERQANNQKVTLTEISEDNLF